jgi:hypothetical protein
MAKCLAPERRSFHHITSSPAVQVAALNTGAPYLRLSLARLDTDGQNSINREWRHYAINTEPVMTD